MYMALEEMMGVVFFLYGYIRRTNRMNSIRATAA
jgi:hypothetical protein